MKKTLIIIFLLLIGPLGYLLWQRETFFKMANQKVTTILRENFGLRVVAARIHGDLFGNIVLMDVRIINPKREDDEIFVEKVSLRYNLLKLLTQREKIEGIQGIELVRPILKVRCSQDKIPYSDWIRSMRKMVFPITIKDGHFELIDREGRIATLLHGIDGSWKGDTSLLYLKIKDGDLSPLIWEGYPNRVELKGEIRLKGRLYPHGEKPSFEGEVMMRSQSSKILSRISLRNGVIRISSLFVEGGSYRIQGGVVVSGPFVDGDFTLVPVKNDHPIKRIELLFSKKEKEIYLKRMRIRSNLAQDTLFTNLNGKVILKGEGLGLRLVGVATTSLDGVPITTRLLFNGKMDGLFNEPSLIGEIRLTDLSIEGERIGDLSHMIQYKKGVIGISTPYKNSLARVNGMVSKDKINLSIAFEGKEVGSVLRFLDLRGVNATLTGVITIRKKGRDGGVCVEGKDIEITKTELPFGDRILCTFTTKGKIIDILKLEFGEKVLMSGRVLLGKPASLDLRARLEKIGIVAGEVNGWIEVKGDPMRMETKGSLLLHYGGRRLSLNEINGMIEEGRVSIKGRVGERGEILLVGSKGEELRFCFVGLRWNELPWSPDYFMRWDGEIKMSGWIKDGVVFARLDSQVKIGNDRFDEFSSKFIYKDGELDIEVIPSQGIRAKGRIFPFTKKVDLKISLHRERLWRLNSFLSLPIPKIDALVRGQVLVEEDLLRPVIKANLLIDPPGATNSVGMIKTKFTFREGIFTTETFHLQQPSGHLRLVRCRIGPFPCPDIGISAELVDFRILKTGLTGRLELNGKSEGGFSYFQGELSSPSIMVNRRYLLKDIANRIIYRRDRGIQFLPIKKGRVCLSGLLDISKDRIIGIHGMKCLKDQKEIATIGGNIDMERGILDLDIAMDGTGLEFIAPYTGFIEKAVGRADLRLHVKGPFSEPRVKGEVSIKSDRMRITHLVDDVRGLRAVIDIMEDSIFIRDLRAEVGNTKIEIDSKEEAVLKARGRPVKIDIPGFFKGRIKPSFKISGSIGDLECKGTIHLYDTRFTYPPVKGIPKKEFLKNLRLDIRIVAKSNVRYYNEYVDIELKDGSWVSLKGRVDDLCIGGVAWARPKRGRVIFLGTRFVVDEATLRFDDRGGPPFIFGTARAVVEGKEIHLSHNGRLFEVEPVLSIPGESPVRNEKEIVRLLCLGRDYREIREEEARIILHSGMLRLIGEKVSSNLIYPLERKLAHLLDLDVEIDTSFIEPIFLQTPTKEGEIDSGISLGRYIAKDLYLNYKARILRESQRQGYLRVHHDLGLELQLPEEESIGYEYRPEEEDHRVILKKELRF